jgi:hypothetical protein
MLKRQLGTLFLVTCLILTTVPAVLGSPSAPVVHVAGDGSGNFNCDGKEDNVQINQALQFVAENPGYTTVYLKGPFTYAIDDTLLIGSNTILEGDSSATINVIYKTRTRESGFSHKDLPLRLEKSTFTTTRLPERMES